MVEHMQFYIPRQLIFDSLEHCVKQYNYLSLSIVETYGLDESEKLKLSIDKKPVFEIKNDTISILTSDKVVYTKKSEEFFSKKQHVQCRSAIEYEFIKYGNVAQYIKEPHHEQYPLAEYSTFKIIIDDVILCVHFEDHIPLLPHSKVGLKDYYQVKYNKLE